MNPLDLINILKGHRVFIQTHNFPDPDAVSSAFGLQQLLDFYDIPSTLCYDGRIDRSSLKKMLDTFGVTMYCEGEITDMQPDDLIVLADSQKLNGNITCMAGNYIACVDHHPTMFPFAYQYKDIRPVGSCASIVASYFRQTGAPLSANCAAALAYGIKMDTADLTRGTAALDMEMLSYLFTYADWNLVTEMYSNTMEFDDLRAYGAAIQNIQIFGGTGFAYIPFHCATALIAIISDFILSLDVVDIAVVYAMQTNGIRFSVRCEQDRIHAGSLISHVMAPWGSGGGHPSMAGGMVPAEKMHLLGEDIHSSIQEAFLEEIAELEKEAAAQNPDVGTGRIP